MFIDDPNYTTTGAGAGVDINAKRLVVLTGNVKGSQWVSPNFFDVEEDIKRWLTAAGFEVVSVKTRYTDLFGYDLALTLELNVYPEFSAEATRQNAIRVIETIQRTIGVTNIKVFSNVNLSVAVDNITNQTVTSDPTKTGSASLPTWQQQPNDLASVSDAATKAVSEFAKGLGLSTPMALLIGGAALLIILKK